jgi:hypothetical protein
MPGGDRTGPLGQGPMTGRGAGYCAGYSMPGYANPFVGRGWFGWGRGFGRGRGWFGRGGGRGWRHWYGPWNQGWAPYAHGGPYYGAYAYPAQTNVPDLTPNEEMNMLKEQSQFLQNELKEIQERMNTLEKAQAQEKK